MIVSQNIETPASEQLFPAVSIIIPTYNRKESLLRTLGSLSRQSYPADRFEVIVVDDGGHDDTAAILRRSFPFTLRYQQQPNRGATEARNHGARVSRGEMLVFMDDDIVPSEDVLESLVNDLASRPGSVCLGALFLPAQLVDGSAFARDVQRRLRQRGDGRYVPFAQCLTGLLATRKADFLCIGMFRDLTGGWPNWDDLEFGHRAHQAGFRFWRSSAATAEHWDYSVIDMETACKRWYRAGRSFPQLFAKHPELESAVGTFRDKGPIAWRQDSPMLIGRKITRLVVWSRPVTWLMKRLIPPLERYAPESRWLRLFYRWIVSGCLFRGYREGLQEAAGLLPEVEGVAGST